jgi:Regulator of chromosome condensation (RCC1) repeat
VNAMRKTKPSSCWYQNLGQKPFFNTTISLAGMQKERRSDMLERSRGAYYSGDMDEEEIRQSNQLTNFGAFSPYVQSTPVLVNGLQDKKVVGIFGGYSYSFFTTDRGECYSFGYNDRCQLGLGHRYNQDQPSLVRFPNTPEGKQPHIVAVACGEQHTLELDSEGRMYSHGGNVFGQLGRYHCGVYTCVCVCVCMCCICKWSMCAYICERTCMDVYASIYM